VNKDMRKASVRNCKKQRTEMGGEVSQKGPKPIQGSSTDDDNDDGDYDV